MRDDMVGRPGGRDERPTPDGDVRNYAAERPFPGDPRDESSPGRSTTESGRAAEIRAEIEMTRGELSETVDAIEERLRPRSVAGQAAERVRHAATDRARDAARRAGDRAGGTVSQLRDRSSEMADAARGQATEAAETVRENPMPSALIGIGAVLTGVGLTLAITGRGGTARGGMDPSGADERMSDRAQELDRQARRAANAAGTRLRQTRRQTSSSLRRSMNQRPLAMGTLAFGIGTAVGLLVPETEREHEWMGEARQSVVEGAQDVARNAAQRAQRAADDAADRIKDVASDAARTVAGNEPR